MLSTRSTAATAALSLASAHGLRHPAVMPVERSATRAFRAPTIFGEPVSWKHDLKLADLDASTCLEITCKRCGLVHYETAAILMQREDWSQLYLDEVERRLQCSARTCRGAVRIALVHDGKTEGFVGGMA